MQPSMAQGEGTPCSGARSAASHTNTPSAAAGEDGSPVREPLVSPEAEDLLKHATELDYMTHLVFRMFENKR